MINPNFMDSYQQNMKNQSPPKNGQKKMFPEKFHTDKMFGQPINRLDQEQAKIQMKTTKNYGDINKINQIYKTTYNLKNPNVSGGNTYQSLHFSKQAYNKNRESSLDTSQDSTRRTGRKIVNNIDTNQQSLSNSYYQSQQNSYREMQHQQQQLQQQQIQQHLEQQQQNYGTPSKNQYQSRNQQNNENVMPHTTISDFLRQPSKDDGRQYQFSPQKRPQFVPDKVSCKKRFDERDHHDTTIVQLINRTSETGFTNDTPSKRLLKTETLTDSFNHLFNQNQRPEGYRPGKRNPNSSRENSAENYQFKNILTGNNVNSERKQGLGMVDQTQYRREEISLANEFRQKVNQQRNNSANNTYSKLYCSNIFFREDLPSRENSAQKTLNDSISNQLPQSATNKLKERKIALYNSNHVRGCLDHSINNDQNAQLNTNTSRERSLNRVPISNISNNVTALMISHEILQKQSKEQQDLVSQILSSQKPSAGKMIIKDRNQSPLTKVLLKNDAMGTPQRFLLSESSNKISSKHQHNQVSSPYIQSTRNYNSHSFFN